MEHPDYYKFREHLIGFLEDQDHRKNVQTEAPPALPIDGKKKNETKNETTNEDASDAA